MGRHATGARPALTPLWPTGPCAASGSLQSSWRALAEASAAAGTGPLGVKAEKRSGLLGTGDLARPVA